MKPVRCLTSLLLATLASAASGQTSQTAPPAPASLSSPAQAASPAADTPSTPSLPTDPTALLQLAVQVNGLRGTALKPWHVHATWQTLDDQKQVKYQGSFEEWWAGANKIKTTWKSDTVDRTFYGTDHGVYVAKRTDEISWQYATVQRLLTTPVNAAKPGSGINTEVRAVDLNQGGVSLHCVLQNETTSNGNPLMVRTADGNARPLEARFCFAGHLPAVRSSSISDGGQIVYNGIVRFQNQYVATKIRSVGAGGTETDIDVDRIEPIDTVADADFTPPPDATLVPEVKTVAVASGVMAGNRIGGANPTYPEAAKASRVQGTVVLQAIIRKDGSISDLKAISGPDILQQAAMDAVKTWRYRPYLLAGEPVDVKTQINVVFALGGH